MMRAVHGSAVLYPSDATSAAALVQVMAGRPGISYLRTTRGGYPVLYQATEALAADGIGSAMLEALVGTGQEQPLRVAHLAVRDMPGSGTGAQLLAAAGVDAGHIESAARGLLGNR